MRCGADMPRWIDANYVRQMHWHEQRLDPWKKVVRQLLVYHARAPASCLTISRWK